MSAGPTPSQRKTERQMNLMFVLLNAGVPRTKARIRIDVPGYEGQSDEAFDRMFERDKQDLRDIGIPIETITIDEGGYEDHGYRIRRDDWLIPKLTLSQDERILLSLAAGAWADSGLAKAAKSGLSGLADETSLGTVNPRLGHRQPNLSTIASAIIDKKQIQFDYRTADGDEVRNRMLDPWRLILNDGIWHLVGWDYLRGEQRAFRLSRIVGAVSQLSSSIEHFAPADLSTQELVAQWNTLNTENGTAIIRVSDGRAAGLRVLAREISSDGETLTIDFDDELELARVVARECDVANVIEPASLRDCVQEILRRALEVHQ